MKKAVLDADPVRTELRSLNATQQRRVVGTPMTDGMGELWALLSAGDLMAVTTALSRAAAGAKAAGDPRSTDQLKEDALAAPFRHGLVDGFIPGFEHRLARNEGQPARVRVTMGLATHVGNAQEPATLHGYGPISAATARELAQQPWVRTTILEWSSVLSVTSVDRYRPSRELKRIIEQRDETCRFPGFGRQAMHFDLDHTVPYPTGSTSAGNLGALCRRHHRLKHEAPGVQLRQVDGRFTWTMPTGHEHIVDPNAPPF